MSVRVRQFSQAALAALLVATSVVAMAADSFPGGQPQQRILETQEKVDSLFEKGDYERAYFIYRSELAPLGDKYAQYMVGYMNLTGKGVDRDVVAGSAWYRLAAERGEANFTRVRDELWQHLNEKQRFQSDEEYMNLRNQYSDAMILAELIEADLRYLENAAEAGNSSSSSKNSTALELSNQPTNVEQARQGLDTRIDYLETALEAGQLMTDDEISRIRTLQKRAQKLLN